MRSLRKFYSQNSIFQFIVSYFLVLFMPLVLCAAGFQIAFDTVKDDIRDSTLSKLNHSKSLIDVQVSSIEDMSLQVSKEPSVHSLIKIEGGRSPGFYLEAPDTIDKFGRILSYQGTTIRKDSFLYLKKTDYVVTATTVYDADFYMRYVKSAKDPTPLKNELESLEEVKPVWRVLEGDFDYIFPVRSDIQGVNSIEAYVVSTLDTNRMLEIFDNSLLGENSYLQIFSRDGTALFSYPERTDGNFFENMQETEGLFEKDESITVYTTSDKTGWKIVLTIPRAQVMVRLNQLKVSVLWLLAFGSMGGLLLASYLAVRNGKPINALFFALRSSSSSGDQEYLKQDLQQLGGVVSQIISKNELLAEQMEREKPLLQTIFLQKLVRGEFVSDNELTVQAAKVGIILSCNRYIAVTFRVFANNDLYNADLNTVQEVSVISKLIQNEIQQISDRPVWFYETDYLTTMVIFELSDDSQEPENILIQVNQKIDKEYRLVPAWGIGNPCTEAFQIWRSCEEAKSALDYGIQNESGTVTRYSETRTTKTHYYFPKLFEHRLINCIRSADSSGIKNLLDILEKENFQNRHLDSVMFQNLHHEIAYMLIKLDSNEDIPELHTLDDISRAYLPETASNYFTVLFKLLLQLGNGYQQEKNATQSKMIERILQYIHASYMDSGLCLSMVAAKFNISEGYVSTLFKEKANVNFAEYVEKLRVDAACELLSQPDITVTDIAKRVGYNSVQSFRRAFKKVTGVSPKEMRN